MHIQSLGGEAPLEKEMAIDTSILAWELPWTEEPGLLQSTGSQRVAHDLVTKQHNTQALFALLGLRVGSSCPLQPPMDSPLQAVQCLHSRLEEISLPVASQLLLCSVCPST